MFKYILILRQKSMEIRGFTLIELLVVIAIIGILASVVMASLNSARTKARDTARISEVKQLKTALELYYLSNNSYPSLGADNSGYPVANLEAHLSPTHMPSVPNDPDAGFAWSYVRGPANAYGLRIYTEADGWCKTGVNVNSGWWGVGTVACSF